MAKITISEGMDWRKTLNARHAELVALRNENSKEEVHYLRDTGGKTIDKKPVYDVKKLDALITQVAREIRKVEAAIKSANAKFKLDYEFDESVLGQVE